MKPLELTEEQKSKLLEMCKDLFPEYEWSFNNDYSNQGMIDMDITKPSFSMIHWFEFCMIHLARKIGNSGKLFDNAVFDSVDLLGEMATKQEWFKSYHPVDFLYEKFKKIS